MNVVYWAKENDKIAGNIIDKFDSYKLYLENSGLLNFLRKSYATYYGNPYVENLDQSLKAIQINHYANLIRHLLVMVTSQRPDWAPQAINSDLASQADTELATGLLDYYMREKGLEAVLNDATEMGMMLVEGWVSLDWDVTGGEIYGQNPENGMPIYEGEPTFRNHTILDIARDVKRRDMNHQWYVVRTFDNKFDLAAKYPELESKIVALQGDSRFDIKYELNIDNYGYGKTDSDIVPVYTLYHEKTPALPMGRRTQVLAHDIKLFDGPLPTKRVYVFCVSTSRKFESSFNHQTTSDLLPVQDVIDATISAIVTNQAANAVQNFQCPKGATPKVTQVADGMNVIEYDPKAGKLEPMNLLQTAPEVFNFATMMINNQQTLSGLSQVSRGEAPPTMSGTAMALLQQQAIQFSNGLQLSRTMLIESTGTALVELLQTFAVTPRVAQIAGKNKKWMMRFFKGDDLKGIARVTVNSGNALTKTAAGKMELANNMLNSGLIKTPEQYLSVLLTGNLEPLYEHDRGQLRLIKLENETMMEGGQAIAFLTDDHAMHVLEHSCIIDSPEARENVDIINALTKHIQEHIDISKGMDPVLANMLKQQSYQQAQPNPQGAVNPQMMSNQNPVTETAQNTPLPKPAQSPIQQ